MSWYEKALFNVMCWTGLLGALLALSWFVFRLVVFLKLLSQGGG
jgi:hypothetical protein